MPLGVSPDGQPDGAAADPQLAVVDLDRQRARIADEAEDERDWRLVVDLVGRADLLDLALAHHHQPVRQLQRLFLIVGDEHRGVAGAVVDLAQPFAQLLADLRVERAERLVEQQHARLDGQRPRQRHALPLAARELLRIALLEARQLHQVEQFHGAAADFGTAAAGWRVAAP